MSAKQDIIDRLMDFDISAAERVKAREDAAIVIFQLRMTIKEVRDWDALHDALPDQLAKRITAALSSPKEAGT